jgi:hypothetical protein
MNLSETIPLNKRIVPSYYSQMNRETSPPVTNEPVEDVEDTNKTIVMLIMGCWYTLNGFSSIGMKFCNFSVALLYFFYTMYVFVCGNIYYFSYGFKCVQMDCNFVIQTNLMIIVPLLVISMLYCVTSFVGGCLYVINTIIAYIARTVVDEHGSPSDSAFSRRLFKVNVWILYIHIFNIVTSASVVVLSSLILSFSVSEFVGSKKCLAISWIILSIVGIILVIMFVISLLVIIKIYWSNEAG